ncbi:MAG: ribosomal protein S18-alanine N-acetyltransferase [Pseudomonadota bacterium]|nr:MAG: ribosomal protein S18-alanine N-acetyltransferase [Pseudomonadota bacterium]
MSAVVKTEADGFRPMTLADLDEIMVIETAAYQHAWTAGIFRDCMHVGYCCWVYQEQGQIYCYYVMSMGAGEAHLLNLCVQPARQGEGLGRMMLGHMAGVAMAHRAETLLLEVRPSNRAAIGLYHSSGFNEVGMRRGYYPTDTDEREDAVIMARALIR